MLNECAMHAKNRLGRHSLCTAPVRLAEAQDVSSISASMCKQGHTSVQILSNTLDEFILDSPGTRGRLVGLVSVWLVSL